jgi:hypothetical protein
LVNTRQNNISELRLKRINDLLNRNERTDQEEKELKYVEHSKKNIKIVYFNF